MSIRDNDIPLVVDLDGTLINTDLLFEGVIALLRKNIFYIFLLLPWSLKGKVYFKNKVFSIVRVNPELLPYNIEVLEFLKVEWNKGRKIILATASPVFKANEIASIYPIFSHIYGTDTEINLKGVNKLKFLTNKFGKEKFDYIGNSNSDMVIFSSARYSYLVNPSESLKRKAKKISNLQHTWNSKKDDLSVFFKAIRVHQWVKNFLIFVPLVTSHTFNSKHLVLQATSAFLSFSFIASAGYLINDLFDLDSDRKHPRKRNRPLASGQLSILSGLLFSLTLLTCGVFIASLVSYMFLFILLFYFVASVSYSFYFKRIVLYDIFLLASLYSIRVIAGGIVTNIPLSFWLIAFSTFIFLSLAFVKRYSELMQADNKDGLVGTGRGYIKDDLYLLQVMGIISGFSSVIVFSLYINSTEVIELYSNPKILWFITLLFLFWISRIWLFTVRGKMTDDPIMFAIKDKTSYFIFLVIGLILLISI